MAKPIRDAESLTLAVTRFRDAPDAEKGTSLIDAILRHPDAIPAQLFSLLGESGKAAALVQWVGYHINNFPRNNNPKPRKNPT